MQRIPEHTYCLCHTSTIHTSYIYRYSQIARIQRLAIHAPRGTSSSRTFARDIRRLNPRPQHAAAIDCWRPCVAGCARRLCVCVCVCVCVVVCACAWGFICAYVYREKEQKREYMEKERERESMPPPLIAGVVRPPIVPADCVCVYIYIYIYICVCVCVYIYIYMYIQRRLIARVAAASSIVPSRFINFSMYVHMNIRVNIFCVHVCVCAHTHHRAHA